MALGAAALVAGLWPGRASADITDFPLREADRPLVLPAGLLEMSLLAGEVQAAGDYDAEGQFVHSQQGDVTHAVVATATVRYGIFRNLEIGAIVPWTADLQAAGSSQTDSGTGRVAVTGAWAPLPKPVADLAFEGALLLPTTSQVLRTDSAGVVHHDHLALSGWLAAKRLLFADGAGHLEAGGSYPFANADDRASGATPPATLFADAGVILQPSNRLWLDAAASVTRTGENRVAGGAVPSSDQYLLALTPTAGFSPTRWYDFALTATVPLAGKNTPQAFELDGRLRARF